MASLYSLRLVVLLCVLQPFKSCALTDSIHLLWMMSVVISSVSVQDKDELWWFFELKLAA